LTPPTPTHISSKNYRELRRPFPPAQFLGEEWGELDVPWSEGFVADLNTALMEQFLPVTLTQGEAVRQPQRVTDDAQGKTVAGGLAAGHSSPAYRT